MITHQCSSIVKVLNEANDLVAYKATLDDGTVIRIPSCNVGRPDPDNAYGTISTGRNAFAEVQESGGTVTSVKQECFCQDDDNREYELYTTEPE